MSSFITESDYPLAIEQEELLRIVKGDLSKLDPFEEAVMDEVSGSINKLYNTEATFAKTENDRDKFLLLLMLHMVIYYTCSSLTPEHMTDVIVDNHTLAEAKLKSIVKGQRTLTKGVLINPPSLEEPTVTNWDIFFNCSPGRDNDFF